MPLLQAACIGWLKVFLFDKSRHLACGVLIIIHINSVVIISNYCVNVELKLYDIRVYVMTWVKIADKRQKIHKYWFIFMTGRWRHALRVGPINIKATSIDLQSLPRVPKVECAVRIVDARLRMLHDNHVPSLQRRSYLRDGSCLCV